MTTKHFIKYKVKPFDIQIDDNGTLRQAIKFKKEVSRTDCTMRNHEHKYYNSDLFPRLLQRQYESIKGEYKTWAYIDELPQGISISDNGFLRELSIELPEDFR